ncbi:YwqJ-related putative deaminase [Photorhabdus sp. RM323S]|uniref:YwqJ-related putative deaminase n=1 Tax=Photorhabdus sp. RM323S TaxID=3342828 RepID=UPI0036DF5273
MPTHDTREKTIKRTRSRDKNSNMTILDTLHLELPDKKAIVSTDKNLKKDLYSTIFTEKTREIINNNDVNYLKKTAAHAGYEIGDIKESNYKYKDGFVNLKDNNKNLADGKLFPGIELIKRPTMSISMKKIEENKEAEKNKEVKKKNKKGEKKGQKKEDKKTMIENYIKNNKKISDMQELNKLFINNTLMEKEKEEEEEKKWKILLRFTNEANCYEINNIEDFISGIKDMYTEAKKTLHPITESLIRDHLTKNENILPTMAGIAGLHAEVLSLNDLFISCDENNNRSASNNIKDYMKDILKSSIFTQRLTTEQAGDAFAACHNCSGILSSPINVITGKVTSAGSNFSLTLSRYETSQESPI